MPKYEFDLQFNYAQVNVTIFFHDKDQAFAYSNRTGSKCQRSDNGHLITLPRLSGLDYIRCSDHTNDLIFVFLAEESAIEWGEGLALVTRDRKEVRIKRKWKVGELDRALNLHRATSKRAFEKALTLSGANSKTDMIVLESGRDAALNLSGANSIPPMIVIRGRDRDILGAGKSNIKREERIVPVHSSGKPKKWWQQ
jgi:hypothetical protein